MALDAWRALLAAYLVGGITLIPLLVIAVVAHGYLTFPYRYDVELEDQSGGAEDDIVQPGDDATSLDGIKGEAAKTPFSQDMDVASGYFAVYREYNPMGINAKPMERPTPVASTTVATPSPSVYQTMYRSIFDRRPVAGPLDNNNRISQRPKKAGNVFYVVLRHGHLMLFDDDEQLEVRHVISLSHHDIGIYSGGDTTPEGELFIKRNALSLTRRRHGSELAPDSQVSKPFYLFSENCSAKEDFYFAMLKNQQHTFGFEHMAPSPKQFELKPIISLVQKLHSSEDQVHSRWLNAILGRVFLGIYKTSDIEKFISEKITKKISRVKRPAFLTNINIQKIDTGDAAPYFSNLRLRDLTVEGECLVETDVKYTGNVRIEVAATAKIDLGTRFKAREVNLVLAVVLKRLEGHILFKIKPPPSNRVWFSFQTMPKLDMVIEPIVSSRQITYTVITRQIENRIKEVFAETLVQPFWDDVPFFKTEHKKWRGGIFEGDDAVGPSSQEKPDTAAQAGHVDAPDLSEADAHLSETRPLEKSHTEPVMESQQPASGLFGRKSSRIGTIPAASVSSTGVDIAMSNTASVPLRSPSIVKPSTEPVVGTEPAHADLFKPSTSPPDHASNYMAALHSRSQDASPKPAVSPGSPANPSTLAHTTSDRSSSLSREGPNGSDKDETDSTLAGSVPPRRNTASSAESGLDGDSTAPQSPTNSSTGSFKNQGGSLGRNFFLRRENSNTSASTSSVDGDNATQKRNTLAAVTSAAAQARQWGWNAIQRQREAMRNGDKTSIVVDLSQPMGRGQPLPPPGTPLPGPTGGKTKIMPIPAPKRKPVPQSESRGAAAAEQGELEPEPESELCSVAPPPLPRRRRRGESQKENGNNEQNILIVAAPDDSQPGTPTIENSRNYGDGHTKERPVRAPDVEATFLSTPDAVMDPFSAQADGNLIFKDSIIAMPSSVAAAVEEDDDDDYSAWMNDVDLEEEEEEPPEQTPVSSCVSRLEQSTSRRRTSPQGHGTPTDCRGSRRE